MIKQEQKQIKNQNQIQKTYHEIKLEVLELEKSNNRKLILFPSAKTKTKHRNRNIETETEKDEWYKLGGNSALIYKYYIAPRLHKKPAKLIRDRDFGPKFKDGIIHIRYKETLLENLKTLGYHNIEEKDDLTIIDLNKTFTPKELKDLKNRITADREKANELIKPADLLPKLYFNLKTLAEVILHKTNQQPSHKELCKELSLTVINLMKVYVLTANSQIEKSLGILKLKTGISNLTALLIIANDLDLFGLKSGTRLSELVANIKESLENL